MFFSGVMRSIASSARKRVECREEDFVHLSSEDVADRMALVGYVVHPSEAERDGIVYGAVERQAHRLMQGVQLVLLTLIGSSHDMSGFCFLEVD